MDPYILNYSIYIECSKSVPCMKRFCPLKKLGLRVLLAFTDEDECMFLSENMLTKWDG
jgi:hypothetical protein